MYCVSIITACGRYDVENFSVKSVAIGLGHTIALKNDGSLLAWGMNGQGQLGTGDNVARLEPVKISTSENWQDVSAGEYNTMAIQTDGTLWGWGCNNYGELGYGTFLSSSIPQKIESSTGFDKVYSISHSTYAIKKDGTLWAWGNNSEYNLGNTLVDDSGVHHTWAVNIPAKITNNNDFITLFVSDSVFLGLRRTGTYLGWGNNRFGLLFHEPLDDYLYIVPHEFDIGVWADISFSSIHAVGIKKDGTLWGWGVQPQEMQYQNYDFESSFLYEPQKISNENGWIKAVAAGLPYAAAIFYMPKDSTEKFPIFTIATYSPVENYTYRMRWVRMLHECIENKGISRFLI
jgi:alpha-tubulin suppressor-like RCC1 family protein